MREIFTYGSVGGAPGNRCFYLEADPKHSVFQANCPGFSDSSASVYYCRLNRLGLAETSRYAIYYRIKFTVKNYIDIKSCNYNKNIYRVMSIARLIDMFENQENTLLKPELWDDPFENFILNIPVKAKTGRSAKSALRNRAYGQCWTKNVESDAMWRIFAPNKDGVKIKTTVNKLFKSLYKSQGTYANISSYIGEVKYYTRKNIEKLVTDRLALRDKFKGSIGQARSLLFKRNAFKYEREIRLIFLHPNNESRTSIYNYPCDFLSLIDSITFDPRMKSSVFKIYRKHIRDLGFKGRIIHSGLYKAPNY